MSFEIENGRLMAYKPDPVELVIPEGVTEIAAMAFVGANLKSVKLASTVKVIKESAFANCKSLVSVELNDGLEVISRRAFDGCQNLVEVKFPSTVKRIETHAFNETKWLDSQIGFNIVGDGILCSYKGTEKEVVVPDGVKEIGRHAFYHNDTVEKVVLPESVEVIEASAFAGCYSLKEIVFPSSMKKIRHNAFCKTALKDVELPEGLEKVSDYSFHLCYDLVNIKLPSSVDKICKSAFEGCHNLEKINIERNMRIEPDAFNECYKLIVK